MATKLNAGVPVDTLVASPGIREAAQWVEDLLVTVGGWVQVPQTGETAPSALPANTAQQQKSGFRCYRMNDALQATAPVFMRIDYGSSAGSGSLHTSFGMWITIGMGLNGSGVMTTMMYNGGAAAFPQLGCNSGANNVTGMTGTCYGSADPSRVCFIMYDATPLGNLMPFVFSLERSNDAAGVDTADGLLMTWSDAIDQGGGGSQQFTNKTRYLLFTAGTQPLQEGSGLNYVMGRPNPTEQFGTNDVGVGLIFHFKGVAQQPGLGLVIVNSNDVGVNGQFPMTIYGGAHVYQSINNCQPMIGIIGGSISTNVRDTGRRMALRFD
jgi:hypothetical protein